VVAYSSASRRVVGRRTPGTRYS